MSCTRNKKFLSQYGKDDSSFSELDLSILSGDFGWNFTQPVKVNKTIKGQSGNANQAKPDVEKNSPKQVTTTVTRQRRSSTKTKQSTPKKTRSGRTIKIPQVDGIENSTESDSSTSEEITDAKISRIPQFDGQTDGQYNTESSGQPQSNSSSYYIGENQNFSGVIPILMPPGIIITHPIY